VPWVRHIFWLHGIHQAGATFHFNDLDKAEWDGLLMIESVRAEIERAQVEKQKEKQMLAQAQQSVGARNR